MFSPEKFLESWIQENIHKICPELEIFDRQPQISWPDGKFGRMDLLAIDRETKNLVIIEVKTRKSSKNSGYDQFLRYTSWLRRNFDQIHNKYPGLIIRNSDKYRFLIITDFVDEEMKGVCRDHEIELVRIFGGLGIERVV